jgi:hypothetical protein
MNNLTVFSPESSVLTYNDKKGASHSITCEGAIIKGGKTLMSLFKDAALTSALTKATDGKYRAASDILCVAFPSLGRSAEKLIGTPWANKATMATLVGACLRADTPSKGWNEKQQRARALLTELVKLPAFVDAGTPPTIEQ